MKVVTVREFADWRTLTEPVRIEKRGVPAGTFYPPGTEPDGTGHHAAADVAKASSPLASRGFNVHEVLERANGSRPRPAKRR